MTLSADRDLRAAAGDPPYARRGGRRPLAGAARDRCRAGGRSRAGSSRTLPGRVHRDVLALGRAVYRRSDRLDRAAAGRAGNGGRPRGGRQYDRLSPPQGHGHRARAARRRRHRPFRPRGRVFPPARRQSELAPLAPGCGRLRRSARWQRPAATRRTIRDGEPYRGRAPSSPHASGWRTTPTARRSTSRCTGQDGTTFPTLARGSGAGSAIRSRDQPAFAVDSRRFMFSPLGADMPLFNQPRNTSAIRSPHHARRRAAADRQAGIS